MVAVIILGICLQSSPAASALTFLHAQGEDIVNEQGEKVLLRGVGLGNWLLPEGYMWRFGSMGDRPRRIEKIVDDLIGPEAGKQFWVEFRNNYIAEADIRRIAALGYNSVRPAINSRVLLTAADPPVYAEEGFVLLDHLVGWCKASGIYVILDMHGAPGGQTGQNIDDSEADQPELFRQPKYQDQLVALWTSIARRYKDEPTVAGYDLLNEPLPGRTGAAKLFKAQLEPFYRRITKAIREVDTRHLIILEGADWANDWSVFSQPFDKNLVYQFHYYCWDNPKVLKEIRSYLAYRDRFHVPVWVGETGEADQTIYWGTTERFEANNIGWSFWPWKKMETQNTPYSIKTPKDWGAVTAYSRGGDKPPKEVAQRAFTELLRNIRLENCVFYPDVVNAMLRRAPVRIEGENYGAEGLNRSFFVRDDKRRSEFYRRSEAVPISLLEANRRRPGQYVTLKDNEWTAYNVASEAPSTYELKARARAIHGPAEVQITLGEQVRRGTISTNGWSEINFGEVALARGSNRLTWLVKSGAADLDWLEVEPAGMGSR
jgi:hypothetical protein